MDEPKSYECVEHLEFKNKNDTGLNLLLPLYHFLRNVCADAAHFILVKGFKEAEYVQNKMKDDVAIGSKSSSFYDFLNKIHDLGKKSDSKDLGEKSDSKAQKGKGKGKSPSSSSQQEMQSHLTKRSTQIHNLSEHEAILNQVTIKNLLEENAEKCKVLRDLDLSFVLNVIANVYICYRLNESVLNAVNQIKEVRNKLFHPKFNFRPDDFIKNLEELVQATEILYHYLYPSESNNLQSIKEAYLKQVVQTNPGPQILTELQSEIHKKYTALPNYVPPIILDSSRQHEPVIEDLPKYVYEHSHFGANKTPPMLLCGSPGTGKSTVLRNLAFSLTTSNTEFVLVLYLDEWSRKNNHQANASTIGTSTEFWDQVDRCIRTLGHDTVKTHGFESVKAVIKEYINSILFLVNWNVRLLGSLFKDMQQGTWVVAYQDNEPLTSEWQALKIQPFTENLVIQFLHKCSAGYQDDVISLYKDCDYKDILTSPDMVKIFCELKSTVNFGTDFELIDAFIKSKLSSTMGNTDVNREVIKLSEVAFNALKTGNKSVYKEKELYNIDSEIKNMFLMHQEGRRTQFVHSIVQEFLAAQNVVYQPSKMCKDWLANAPSFMRVFKFACGMWCKDNMHLENMMYFIEEYLVELFDIKSLKKDARKNQKTEPMEVDKGNKKHRKEKKQFVVENLFRNPFSNWEYLIELDDVCQGHPLILKLFSSLLSHIPCWTFKSNVIDDRKLRRIEIIVKKVKLKKESPITIKLESSADVSMLLKIWNKLKNIKSLHECAFVRIAVMHGKSFPFVEQESLTNLCNTIVRAHCPIYITSYKGPFLCSTTPEFLKCMCVLKIINIDVTVYDIASLSEILKCDKLPSLKDISVTVNLKMDEQLLTELKQFKIPEHLSLTLRIKYFDNIQELLNRAQSPHNLLSLSIYDVYVNENFNLDLSMFRYMENLNIICEPNMDKLMEGCSIIRGLNLNERLQQITEHEAMDTDESVISMPPKKKLPRHDWMLPITVNLIPPKKLERLLFRNMDFYKNSNNFLLLNILKKHSIQKLMILDSQLSLKGAQKVLSSHTNAGNDDIEHMTKKLRINRSDTTNISKLISKKPRLTIEEREKKRIEKPQGKEIIITSDVQLCKRCSNFPCLCTHHEGLDSMDNLEALVYLIEDVYEYDIVSFNYTSKVVTVRKNVCGDLGVHCVLPGLDDSAAYSVSSTDSTLNRLFITLTLAQNICLEQTNLTFDGAEAIVDYFKTLKGMYSVEKVVEPFSLTIRSGYHTSDYQVIVAFAKFIRRENIFTTFNFWCSCENKCFKLKKAHSGKIFYNDRVLDVIANERRPCH